MIKRYDMTEHCGQHMCDCDITETSTGEYVEYSAYTAVLAENADRGEIIERLIGIFGASGCHAIQNSNDPCNSLMYDAMQVLKSTATDAALVDVKKQAGIEAVERLIGRKKKVLTEMHPDTHAFGATAMSLRAQINELQVFAGELREAK
ncbi:hypothetical protein [Serratia entomophila]|uniref:hypothetical protein n=1 Tax=Serratia entomophila TaxID=42906 RepID=UPI00217A5C06|nr:hypothetical protein [Serratia entomophila]CAI2057327.1 Uncharacterised protein [Serratia entomophila]